ncbi:MAG TPA: NifU family protein [Polyangiaceae bacterium]|nr:NifU family protein [Polyangiaceae bacterium]
MASPREQILATVREIVAPLVRADGGDVYVVHAGDKSLTLHLSGKFSGCPGNTLLRRRVIEPLLAARFPGLELEMTSGPRLPPGAERIED